MSGNKSWDDDNVMNFGRFKGTKMRDVPDSYLRWLLDQTWFTAKSHPGLFEYVKLAVGE